MALIKCSECGKQISDKASECIHCGCPVELSIKSFCEECGKEVSIDDSVCKSCGCPINIKDTVKNESSNKKDKNNIKYENLTKQQMLNVVSYRKNSNQWLTGVRVLSVIVVALAAINGSFVVLVPIVPMIILGLLYFVSSYLNSKLKAEEIAWFDNNINNLVTKSIIDERKLRQNSIKDFDELNKYDLDQIKAYRISNNEWKTKIRSRMKIAITFMIIGGCFGIYGTILIAIGGFILSSTTKKVTEEDKEWYEKNKERVYKEKYLPF